MNSTPEQTSETGAPSSKDHGARSRLEGSTISNRLPASNSPSISNVDRSILLGRILFCITLVVSAVVLAVVSLYLLRDSEQHLANRHFDSISERALSEASSILLARRWSTILMSSLVAEMLPNTSSYPFVSVPGYERIVNDLLNISKGEDTALAVLVKPDQQERWENYAYNFFYNEHKPVPFPNNTGLSSFGRGIWAIDANSSAPDRRFHDKGQTCKRFNCSYPYLAPVFQVDEGSNPILMFNLHSDPVRGTAIENMLDCVYGKIQQGNLTPIHPYRLQDEADLGCAVTLRMTQVRKFATRGPASPIFQPIRPIDDRTVVAAIVMMLTVWDSLLENVFPSEVSGVDCVLSNQWEKYTYRIESGEVAGHGYGDNRDWGHQSRCRSKPLTPQNFFADTSPEYTLTVCPTDRFYDSYQTTNPRTALIGTLFIMIFTSLLFFLYDYCVRRDLVAKKDLLEAKRRFMRFVSHEVRTPLNAVCMGLDVIASEVSSISEALRKCQNDLDKEGGVEGTAKTPLFDLGEDTDDTATSSETKTTSTPLFGSEESGEKTNTDDQIYSPVSCQEKEKPLIEIPNSGFSETINPPLPVATSANSTTKNLSTVDETGSVAPAPESPRDESLSAGKIEDTPFKSSAAVFDTLGTSEGCLDLVREVQESAQNAVDVLNDILNYDKIEQRDLALELSVVPIWDVLTRVVNEFRLPSANKNQHLQFIVEAANASSPDEECGAIANSVDALPVEVRNLSVVGDAVRLKQVLRNLISNAIKFTPDEGQVTVHVVATESLDSKVAEWEEVELKPNHEVTMRQFGELEVRVTDTGAGMNEDQLKTLFGEGVQFNANELQEGGGSGLGLWISKGIVERHRGRLSVRSEGLGHGTTFELRLPLCQSKMDGLQPLATETSDASKAAFRSEGSRELRLLIVDDVGSNRKLLRRLLEMKGHECEDAENGQQALDKVTKSLNHPESYDSVLMDMSMPVMDGPTATKAIRALGSDVFIVGVTGNMLDEDVDYFRSCGANAVVGKPVNLKALEDLWVEYGLLSGVSLEGLSDEY